MKHVRVVYDDGYGVQRSELFENAYAETGTVGELFIKRSSGFALSETLHIYNHTVWKEAAIES